VRPERGGSAPTATTARALGPRQRGLLRCLERSKGGECGRYAAALDTAAAAAAIAATYAARRCGRGGFVVRAVYWCRLRRRRRRRRRREGVVNGASKGQLQGAALGRVLRRAALAQRRRRH